MGGDVVDEINQFGLDSTDFRRKHVCQQIAVRELTEAAILSRRPARAASQTLAHGQSR